MSTLVVYGDAADGYIYSTDESNFTYSVARAGTDTKTVVAAATSGGIGQDAYPTVMEAFLGFDTSAIDDADTISSATLQLTSNGNSSDTDFTIEARLYDWGGTLTGADFVPGADLSGDTLLASYPTASGWTTGTAYDLTSDAAFVSNVNKTGTTYLCLSSSRTRLDNEPSGDERVAFRTADYTGTTSDPKLTIEYSPSGTPALTAVLRRTVA